MTSERRSKARRAYKRTSAKITERQPGEKGYAAFWRQEFGNAAPEIKDLRGGDVSGRAIIAVMNVYGAEMNNTTGRSHHGQRSLANRSGTSERVVRRVQQWVIEYGWQELIAPAIPGVKGKTVAMTIGWLPDVSASNNVSASNEQDDVPASGDDVPASSDDVPASSGRGTLIKNSHKNSQSDRHPDTDKAPCFCRDNESCCRCTTEEAVEMCDFHGSYAKDDCYWCDQEPAPSRLTLAKQEELHVRHLAQDEGLSPWGEPLEDARPRDGFVLGSRSHD